MITSREFSILSRIARLIVNDHKNGRLTEAKKKLVSPKAKLIAKHLEEENGGTSKLAKQILDAAKAQYRTNASLTR